MRAIVQAVGILAVASLGVAQEPGRDRDRPPRRGGDDLLVRMMAYDKDKDGVLTKQEVADARLQRLFDRADADKNGSVTKEELTTLVSQEPPMERGGPPGGGPGGFRGGPPRPGEILPPPLQERLELTADQKKALAELQREVDARLEKILNEEQNAHLKELRERGPGFGPGGPGFGPGGRPGFGPGGPGRGGRRGPGQP